MPKLATKCKSDGPWKWHWCRGGVMLEKEDAWDESLLIEVGLMGRDPAPSTALKKARRIIKVLNAGEKALAEAE